MQVRELMTTDPAVCTTSDTCARAGELMRQRQCGFLPIVESPAAKRLVGVLTDRDLALHLTRTNAPANTVKIAACMTANPTAVAPEADLTEAAQLMESLAVHRLPVVQNGQVIGVLSLKDIAIAARQQWAKAGPNVPARQLTEILEAIAAARLPAERVRAS